MEEWAESEGRVVGPLFLKAGLCPAGKGESVKEVRKPSRVSVVLIAALACLSCLFGPYAAQHAMAETKTSPAVKPVLDLSGIAEIQSIPVGEMRSYELRETLEWFIEMEREEIEWGRREITTLEKFRTYLEKYYGALLTPRFLEAMLKEYGADVSKYWDWRWECLEEMMKEVPLETILESIANLAILQMGLGEKVEWSVYPKETPLPYGTFGWALQEILGVNPERDFGLTVEHTDFMQTDLGKKDCYRLTINCRDIDLILRDCGTPDYLRREYGYEWGIRGLTLSQYSERRDARGIPYTEEKELFIHQVEDKQNPGKYKFVAIYTVRTLAPDGTVVEWEEWEFAQGNPNAIYHRKL